MLPEWAPPCNNQCTHKYASFMQIPWRVFCKKGCDADGDTWDECKFESHKPTRIKHKILIDSGLGECDEICYKDPVLKDKQWSAFIDRSPGSASYSEECFRACVSGCGYKFDIPLDIVKQVHSRPPKARPEEKPRPLAAESVPPKDEVLGTSA